MSQSKFIMAKKLHNVQKRLMGKEIQDTSLEPLTQLIFEECSKEGLTFWFNFLENLCVINLRDISSENNELNHRYVWPISSENLTEETIKRDALINFFLITKTKSSSLNVETKASSAKRDEPINIVSGDKPVPSHIRQAIQKLEAKGVPITVEGIKNHLPLNEMSSNSRIKCNAYLKRMEASE